MATIEETADKIKNNKMLAAALILLSIVSASSNIFRNVKEIKRSKKK